MLKTFFASWISPGPWSPQPISFIFPIIKLRLEEFATKPGRAGFQTASDRLRDAGVQGPALSVETLDYPLEWIEQILREYDLRVCLDMGHLIVNHENIETTYHRFAGQTPMIHLHGVKNGKDHLALDVFDQSWLDRIFSLLKQFTGTVSIEVFSYNHLLASLAVLERNMG